MTGDKYTNALGSISASAPNVARGESVTLCIKGGITAPGLKHDPNRNNAALCGLPPPLDRIETGKQDNLKAKEFAYTYRQDLMRGEHQVGAASLVLSRADEPASPINTDISRRDCASHMSSNTGMEIAGNVVRSAPRAGALPCFTGPAGIHVLLALFIHLFVDEDIQDR